MATLTIRPISHSQIGSIAWQNPLNAYDGDLNTWSTISSTKTTAKDTKMRLSFNYNSLPTDAIISSATLSWYGRGNKTPILGSNKIIIYDQNEGDLSDIVGSTSNEWYSMDVTSLVSNKTLTSIVLQHLVSQSIGSTTVEFYINDVKIDIMYEEPAVTDVILDKTSLTLFPNDLAILNATVNVIGNIPNLFVMWHSENENVATVKAYSGNQATIKPTGFGKTNIVATSIFDNNKQAKTLVSVPDNSFSKLYCGENKIKEIKINNEKVLQVYLGEVQIFMSTEEFQTMIMNQSFE